MPARRKKAQAAAKAWKNRKGKLSPSNRPKNLRNWSDESMKNAIAAVMHLSICCPTLPLLGCIGDLPGDLTQDFPPGVGNLTVKSLMLPRGSIEMYTGFDTLARPL